MLIKKNKSETCTKLLGDNEIHIYINEQKYTIESTFTELQICTLTTEINILQDIFQLNFSDGFCIESLFVNGNEILGPNSHQHNCGDVGMPTSEMKIQNEEIIYLQCKGKDSLKENHIKHKLKFELGQDFFPEISLSDTLKILVFSNTPVVHLAQNHLVQKRPLSAKLFRAKFIYPIVQLAQNSVL